MSSKRVLAIKQKYNPDDILSLDDCILKVHEYRDATFVLQNGKSSKLSSNFDESISVQLDLGVDGKRSDQMIKFAITLPHNHGKKSKVLCITNKNEEAVKSGALFAGGKDMLIDIAAGKFNLSDYDICVTSESMMKDIATSGAAKNLGIKGLMPNPKVGTVFKTDELMTSSLQDIVYKNISVRSDKFGDLKCSFAKLTSDANVIRSNILMIIERVKQMRPVSLKGVLIKSINISTTGGFSCYIDSKI